MNTPTISVIIPVYNGERTIIETINSVQKQTFSDFELIVINDGSTDGTLRLLNEIKDSRLKVFSYSNGGLSESRNRGITHAKGEFITFLDADDLWTDDKLELQLQALQKNPEAGVAYSWTYFMEENGEYCHTDKPLFFEGNVLANLLTNNFIASGSNPLISKQAIESVGKFDTSLPAVEDWDYWLRLAAKWQFAVVPKPQVFYRLSSSSMSSKVELMEECQVKVIDRAFEFSPSELQFLKNQSLAYIYQYSCKLYLTKMPGAEGIKNAREKMAKTIKTYPQILLQSNSHKLLIKLLIKTFIPEKISDSLLHSYSKLRATNIS